MNHDKDLDPVDIDTIIERLRAVVAAHPATGPFIARFLEHLARLATTEKAAADVVACYRFCRESPDLVLLLVALANITLHGLVSEPDSDDSGRDDAPTAGRR